MAESGDETPAQLSRPDVPAHLAFEWRAYAELRSDRPVGLDTGLIPWTSIAAYARFYGIVDVDEFERFLSLIRAMERVENEFSRRDDKPDHRG